MASRQIKIIVEVKNYASAPLKDVEKSVKKVGQTTDDVGKKISKFNRAFFSTSAVVSTFTRATSSSFAALEKSANFDRIATQFESVFGDSLINFKDKLKNASGVAIDTVEAMRAAVSLGQLGIKKDIDSVADFLKKAGLAAKLAGLNSSEGIREMTEFLKDGSITHLQYLNLIEKSNAGLQASLSVTMHSNKLLGAMLSTQEKLALAQTLLNRRTKDGASISLDFADALEQIKNNLNLFKLTSGSFIGKSISPLIDGLIGLTESAANLGLKLRSLLPEGSLFIKFLVKALGTTLALVGGFKLLRLSIIGLGSLASGFPKLTTYISLFAAVFSGLTGLFFGASWGAKDLSEKLGIMGSAWESIAQLIQTSTDPKNLGIGKVSSILYDELPDSVKVLVRFFGRVGAVVKVWLSDTVSAIDFGLTSLWNAINLLFATGAAPITSFIELLDKPWPAWLISPNISGLEKLTRWAVGFAAAFVGILTGMAIFKKTLGSIQWFGKFTEKFGIKGLIRATGLGKIFGGDKKPDGTASDPVHVVADDGFLGGLKPITPGTAGQQGVGSLLGHLGKKLIDLVKNLKSIIQVGVAGIFQSLGPVLAVTVAAGFGLFIGDLIQKKMEEEYPNFLESIFFPIFKFLGVKGTEQIEAGEKAINTPTLEGVNAIRVGKGQKPLTSEEWAKSEARMSAAKVGPIAPTSETKPSITTVTSTLTEVDKAQNQNQAEAIMSAIERGQGEQNVPYSGMATQQNQNIGLMTNYLKQVAENTKRSQEESTLRRK